MQQMRQRAVEVVGQERAAGAALVPVRSEHEVIDDQLAAAVEQVCERAAARRRGERVALVEPRPRQRPALCDQRVARA